MAIGQSFSWALTTMAGGERVQRQGWQASDKWMILNNGSYYTVTGAFTGTLTQTAYSPVLADLVATDWQVAPL